MEPLEAERDGGPEEAAVDEARVTDSPTRVSDSSERLSNARPASRVTHSAASVGSPADRLSEPLDTPRTTGAGTSTGVDTGAMPQTTENQAAWDGSAMPISTGRDTDSMSIAVVAVTTEQSADLSSTGVGTALQASTRAYDDDGASSSGTERDAAQWKIVPQSSVDFGKVNRSYIRVSANKERAEARSLIETQKSSIKLLQEELGEEAEFDAEESAQMRHVRRECKKRIIV